MNVVKYYADYIQLLNEGLIKSYESDISFGEIIRSLRLLKFNVNGEFEENRISLIIKDFNDIPKNKIDDLFDHINITLVNKFGWFPSTVEITNINSNSILKKYNEDELKLKQDTISIINIEYDKGFDEIEKITPNKLYHLSIQEYENKILKNGLFPKSKSKLSSHLDRVYLCKSPDDCDNLVPQMKLYYSEEKDDNLYTLGNKRWNKNTKWIIFETKSNNIKLYKDPRYKDGYYTLDNIDPKMISIYSKEI